MSKLDENEIKKINVDSLPKSLVNSLERSRHRLHLREYHYTWVEKDEPSDNSDDWLFITTTDITTVREMKIDDLSQKEIDHLNKQYENYYNDLPKVPNYGLKMVKIKIGFNQYTTHRTFDEEYEFITNELIKIHGEN